MADNKARKGRKPTQGVRGKRDDTRRRKLGLPDEAHVVAEKTFTSPSGTRYRILRTNETDAYDPPPRRGKKRR